MREYPTGAEYDMTIGTDLMKKLWGNNLQKIYELANKPVDKRDEEKFHEAIRSL